MPQDPRTMDRWRTWTLEQREQILQDRRRRAHPPHSPAHLESDTTNCYMITSACFEHQPIIGRSEHRLGWFSIELCQLLQTSCQALFAWVVLPNHYHALVISRELKTTLKRIGLLHGRSSFTWNGEDDCRGRKVWCNAAETAMKSEGHLYATINYILNNPVHHGYCRLWTQWPFSNATNYLESIGRESAIKRWNDYPLHDYGQSWDPPDM